MMKIVFVVFSCFFFSHAFSQDSTYTLSANTKKITITNRPNDHFLIQISSDHWNGMTDSIRGNQKGLSRGFNAYFMLDKPFRASPKYSVGFGIGISTSNMMFKTENIDLSSTAAELPFTSTGSGNHFKKYKLSTGYLEVPIEIRYSSKPSEPNKSFKVAAGAKIGVLVNAHTKGKNLEDNSGSVIDSYILKENSKRFVNGTRLMATARVGYGILSLFGSYQISSLLKAGAGPNMHLYQIGLTISGL
jgi:Outer membrane protein beta-barrel domain